MEKEPNVDVASAVPRSSKKRSATTDENMSKRVDVSKGNEPKADYEEENSCQTQ